MDAVYRSSRPARLHRLNRRQVLLDLGWGGVAVAVLAGCSTSSTGSTGSANAATPGAATSSSGAAATGTTSTTATGSSGGELAWKRVDLGFVSAYLLVRGSSVAIVDTGVAGSADAIGTALQAASVNWDSVTESYEALAAKLSRGYSTRGMSSGRRTESAWSVQTPVAVGAERG